MTTSTTLYPMAPPHRPRAQPTCIHRGKVYCDKDFWSRSAAWFVQQQEQLRAQQAQLDKIREEQAQQKQMLLQQEQQQQKAKTAKKPPRWASTATPTRVQPARAAKGKKRYANDDDNEASTAPAQKKVKTSSAPIQMPTPSPTPTPSPPSGVPVEVSTPSSDYMLDPAWATTSLSTFQAAVDTLLEGKRATLSRSCFWSTSKTRTPPSPSSSSTCVSRWCPIVALPLACTDLRYCSHGRSWPPSFMSVAAPVACMSPPPTPPPTPPPVDAVRFQAKPFAELRHFQERTVSLAGLRFAVDMCNGMLRVYMV